MRPEPQVPIEVTSRYLSRESKFRFDLCMQMTGFVVVKTGQVKRNVTTVCLLLIVSCYFTVGCLRQPSDVISQSSKKKSEDALIASKSSSNFNFFGSKKNNSDKESVAKVKVSGSSPNINRIDLGAEGQPPGIEIAENSLNNDRDSSGRLNKPNRKTVEAPLENWRSKSLVESAKKYPAKVAETYHRKMDRIKLASSSVNQKHTNGIQRVSNAIPAAESQQAEPKASAPASQSELAEEAMPFRTEQLSRSLDQVPDQKKQSKLPQMSEVLKQNVKQMQPTIDDVNQEMRRLQIDSVMGRAKRELKQKNYEYAEFLAEQALEASYRGHVAFGIEEQSPQMLLQQIESSKPALQASNVQAVEHAQPRVETNSGQKVHNFQFQPSRVHPLKRRAVAKPKSPEAPRTQSRPSTGSEELPLIVPRNMGNEPQTITIQPRRRQSDVWSQKKQSGGIGLGAPTFEEKAEEPLEIPFPKKTVQPETSSVPSPSLGLEEVPEEPPARIRLSGPEPAQQEPIQQKSIKAVEKAEASSAPGPRLMLPRLPGDLTSQNSESQGQSATMLNHSGGKQGFQTAPVKFQSKIQERREKGRVLNGENRNGPLAETSLVLDEIEWDLDGNKRPQLRNAWSGMTTLLLIVGGVIILLLLMIIVILLRRGNPSP